MGTGMAYKQRSLPLSRRRNDLNTNPHYMKRLLSIADVILFTGFKFIIELPGNEQRILGELSGINRAANQLLFRTADDDVFIASPEDILFLYAKCIFDLPNEELIEFVKLVTKVNMEVCEVERPSPHEIGGAIILRSYADRLRFFIWNDGRWQYTIHGASMMPLPLNTFSHTLWLISKGVCPFDYFNQEIVKMKGWPSSAEGHEVFNPNPLQFNYL